MPTKCMYESKHGAEYVKCKRNGSVRNKDCKSNCRFYKRKYTFLERLERWLTRVRGF